jgi:hypothetical protein
MGLWIHWFRDHNATISNGSVTTGWTSLVSVGHSRSDSIVSLMLRRVCYAMAEVLTLYYRFLGTESILLRRGNREKVMDNIIGTLLDMKGKTKDNLKA